MFSDESDDDYNESESYSRKYRLLAEKCDNIQQHNEMLVHRLQRMKKYLHRVRKQRIYIMKRLDRYHDDWRTADYPIDLGLDEFGACVDLSQNGFVEPSSQSTNSRLAQTTSAGKVAPEKRLRGGKTRKRREGKAEKDPNAPKRPANPFFQFCQEQRPIVLDSMTTSANREPSKQELTKQLAANWNVLPRKDKKIYYDKYMRSKEKYIVSMEEYTMKKAKQEQDATE